MNNVIDINIKKDEHSLKDVANELNDILGISLMSTDRYDEVPAFEYKDKEYQYILWGIPDEEHHDMYDHEVDTNNFIFQIIKDNFIDFLPQEVDCYFNKFSLSDKLVISLINDN